MGKTKISAEKRCRACLKSLKRRSHCIESKTVSVDDNIQVKLYEIYNQCTQIVYDSDSDAEWKWMCDECFGKLVDFFKFRQMCNESYISFKGISLQDDQQIVDEINFKTEVEIDAVEIPTYSYENEAHLPKYEERQTANDVSDDRINEDILQEIAKIESDVDEPFDFAEPFAILDSSHLNQEEDEYRSHSPIEEKVESVNVPAETKKPKSSESNLICDICSKRFFKKHRLDAHKRKHLGLKQWKCEHCEKSFEKYSNLQVHLSVNHYDESEGRPEFICDSCGNSYQRKETLRIHMLKVHLGIKPKTISMKICEHCGKTFKNKSALVEHSYTHTKVTPHKCHICSKMFPTNCRLKEHIMRHDGIKNFVCPTCGLRKTTKNELRAHMKHHSEDNHFPCELCPSVFTRLENRKRHMKVVHCGIRAYPCPHCDRSFGKAETLKHHVMTHTGERPNKCEICDKRFIQPTALKTHMKTHNKK